MRKQKSAGAAPIYKPMNRVWGVSSNVEGAECGRSYEGWHYAEDIPRNRETVTLKMLQKEFQSSFGDKEGRTIISKWKMKVVCVD